MKHWAIIVGTVFGLGYAPVAPGTVASVATALVFWAFGGWGALASIVLVLGLTVLGLAAAPTMERRFGSDPSEFVLDEVVGTLVALSIAPASWMWCLAGLVLFRIFDIAKPWPVSALDRIPGGFGIMFDDIAAGLGAAILLGTARAFI
jgi:phosphatidylglycerophosphatase A